MEQVAAFASSPQTTEDNIESLKMPNVLQFTECLTVHSLLFWGLHGTSVPGEKRLKSSPELIVLCAAAVRLTRTTIQPLGLCCCGHHKEHRQLPAAHEREAYSFY